MTVAKATGLIINVIASKGVLDDILKWIRNVLSLLLCYRSSLVLSQYRSGSPDANYRYFTLKNCV